MIPIFGYLITILYLCHMRPIADIPLEKYLEMEGVTPSQVLSRLIAIDGNLRKDIARKAGIPAQRLSDLISGTRRFTARYSLGLERALNIKIKGFFLLLQAKNDIYIEERKAAHRNMPNTTKFLQSTFWDVNLHSLDWQRDKKSIVNRVFEYGSDDEVMEIISYYGKESVANILENGKYARVKEIVLDRIRKFL